MHWVMYVRVVLALLSLLYPASVRCQNNTAVLTTPPTTNISATVTTNTSIVSPTVTPTTNNSATTVADGTTTLSTTKNSSTLTITTLAAETTTETGSGTGSESTTLVTETTASNATTPSSNVTTSTNTSNTTTGITMQSTTSATTEAATTTAPKITTNPTTTNKATTTPIVVTTTKPEVVTTSETTKVTTAAASATTTATPTTTTESEPQSDNSALILGISLTLFFIILLVFLLVLYFYCNNKNIPCLPMRRDDSTPMMPMRQSTKRGKFAVGHMWISKVSFESSYKKNIADDNKGFREEYKAVKTVSKDLSQGKDPVNLAKNRYENVIPYDDTRVVLTGPDGDYINANFVPGYLAEKKFIACQGPKDTTEDDFWRMMWQQKSAVIVMVTNLIESNKLKCHQYWPNDLEPGSTKQYGAIKVTFVESKLRTFYTYRLFKIAQYDEPERLVHQLHYTAWPDFGVPKSAAELLLFRRRVMEYNPPHSGPTVVHCSAGVGRTGTYILVDASIEQLDAEGRVDLFSALCKMRNYRMMLIQTDAQYAFAHLAVLEHIKYGNTEVTVKEFPEQVDKLGHMAEDSEDTIIEDQFDKLVRIPLLKNEMSSGRQSIKKNRLLQIIPYDTNRVTIPRKPGQERSDYINASFIDGFQEKRTYIATQGPLTDTVEDFWSMVWHYQVRHIVMLTGLVEKGQECCTRYWPENVGDTEQIGKVSVRFNSLGDNDVVDYNVREIILSHQDSTEAERVVSHYHYNGWPEVGQPSDVEGFLEIITSINEANDPPRPIVVHCSSGGGRTGIFCCLSILVERCEAEGLIDVYQTIKKLRDQRPHIIQTKEQLEFCYTTMLRYLETNQMLDSTTLTSDLDFDGNVEIANGNISPSSGKLKNGNGYVNLAMEADISGSMNNQLDLDSQNGDKSSRSEAENPEEDSEIPAVAIKSEDSLTTEDETKNQKSSSSNDGSEFEIVVDKNGDVV